MTTFAHLRERFRTSLWILPGCMGVLAVLLAAVLLYLEAVFDTFVPIKWFRVSSDRTISIMIGTLLGAIVTVFGIMLPMTFSILLRASNQFTPMVLRVYRSALAPKIFLGLMFSTTLYLMVLLAALNHLSFFVVPGISIIVGFILFIIAIYSIPAFFHQVATSLEPTYLVEMITRDLKGMLEKLERLTSLDELAELESCQDRSCLDRGQYRYTVFSPVSRYIQSIDSAGLVKLCQQESMQAAVPVRPGDFVLEGNPILYFIKEQNSDDELNERLCKYFTFGNKRIGISDFELQLDELLSIVVRALSPGVTDLSTAFECINHVGSICNLILNRRLLRGVHKDENDQNRLFTKEFDFYGFIHAAFDTIRQNADPQPAIVLHALNIIQNLVNNCHSNERAQILQEVALQLVEEAKGQHLPFDLEKMQHYLKSIESTVKEIKS